MLSLFKLSNINPKNSWFSWYFAIWACFSSAHPLSCHPHRHNKMLDRGPGRAPCQYFQMGILPRCRYLWGYLSCEWQSMNQSCRIHACLNETERLRMWGCLNLTHYAFKWRLWGVFSTWHPYKVTSSVHEDFQFLWWAALAMIQVS